MSVSNLKLIFTLNLTQEDMKRFIKTTFLVICFSPLLIWSCGSKESVMIDGRNVHHIRDLREAKGETITNNRENRAIVMDSIVDPKIQKILDISEENKKNQEKTKETLDQIENIIKDVLSDENKK